MVTHVKIRLLVAVIAVVATSLPMLAGAAGLGFLKNTPLYYFTQQDMQLMIDTAKSVLDDPNALATREWANPKNRYSGKVDGLGSFKSSDGLVCRKLRISTQAKGIENAAVYPVCKTAQGEWRLAAGKRLEKE